MRYVLLYLRYVYCLPLLILFAIVSKAKKELILSDVDRMSVMGRTPWKKYNGFVHLFSVNKYFRTVVYSRLGRSIIFFKWLYPTSESFIICPNIGSGLYIAHPFATIVNAKRVGTNLSIRNSTTIGNKMDGRKDLLPTIGDNVTIGANVVVIGEITIGNNVTIGAGSVIVKDIPDYAIVVGNPQRIIGYKNH